jgi:hypothetical protein
MLFGIHCLDVVRIGHLCCVPRDRAGICCTCTAASSEPLRVHGHLLLQVYYGVALCKSYSLRCAEVEHTRPSLRRITGTIYDPICARFRQDHSMHRILLTIYEDTMQQISRQLQLKPLTATCT